jgi:hypothetical protein
MAVTNLIQIISHQLNGLHRDSRRLISKRSQLFLSNFSEMAIAAPKQVLNETLIS